MDIPKNTFKTAVAALRPQIGLWSSLCSNIAAEIVAKAGFDWILLDTEHAPNETPSILAQLQASAGGSAHPVVRPAWNDIVLIKRFLDLGAQTLLIPYVQSADEARDAVRFSRYPPKGVRGVSMGSRAVGYGRQNGDLNAAEREICVLVQIETREGLKNLERITEVDGVDGVFFGPADLSADLGLLGQPGHPEAWRVMEDAVGRVRKLGKPPGILVGEADGRRALDMGCVFVAVGSDIGLLTRGTDALAAKFRQA